MVERRKLPPVSTMRDSFTERGNLRLVGGIAAAAVMAMEAAAEAAAAAAEVVAIAATVAVIFWF